MSVPLRYEIAQDTSEAGKVVEAAQKEAEKRLGKPVVTKELPNVEDDILDDKRAKLPKNFAPNS